MELAGCIIKFNIVRKKYVIFMKVCIFVHIKNIIIIVRMSLDILLIINYYEIEILFS